MIKFKEIKTREEFTETLPVMKQDLGDVDVDAEMIDNFILAAANNYRHFAGYMSGKVVAVIGMTKVFNPCYQKPVYDITNFTVDEKHRSKGIGSKLIDFCKNIALEDGANCLRLCAYPDNYKALAFYQKNGFQHTANFMFQSLEKN